MSFKMIIEIKEDVKIGDTILEVGDKINVLENSSLRFTGSKIPADLVNALGWFSDLLLGYDHTDKGYLLQFNKPLSPGSLAELARKLKVEKWQISLDDEENAIYHVSD